MLLSSLLQPEDTNPSLQAAIDTPAEALAHHLLRARSAPTSHLGQGWRHLLWAGARDKPWEHRGDVLTPKPGAAQSRADTTRFKKINEWFCAQERQGEGKVT